MYNQGKMISKTYGVNRGAAWFSIIRHIEAAKQCGLFFYEVGETPQYFYWYGKSTDWKSTGSGA